MVTLPSKGIQNTTIGRLTIQEEPNQLMFITMIFFLCSVIGAN